jgi:4-amino-4-deoxy-L-arabinose transferase-like glycosyltransferase
MFRRFDNRSGHYVLLLCVAAGLFLVNLGGPSLWDIDEGNNAEAAREMLASGNWVVPTFNFELRVDKPALLYWLQIGAYEIFGVNEFAARLPSALAALATVLLTYELGRRMFGPAAGLLAGLVLASTAMFCAAAHFANPDALLVACTTLTLLVFWLSYARGGRGWFVPAGVTAGLAFLAKGPVGLVLPLGVCGLFLLWSRRLTILLDRRLALGVLAFLLVALPWYAWVGAETKGEFLRGFFLTHNRDRFLNPMENHAGPVFYYLLVLVAGFAPWSVFFGLVGWYALRALRPPRASDRLQPPSPDDPAPFRFLICWIVVYLVFFSASGTKLPNYVLPLYPPAAILTACFLDRWRRGVIHPPGWVLRLSLVCLALFGVVVLAGLCLVGGLIPSVGRRGRPLEGLGQGAWLGLLPLLAASAAWWCLRHDRRPGFVLVFAATAVGVIGALAAWAGSAFNRHKAPQALASFIQADQANREVRIACYQYFQPSLVFYARREVTRLDKEQDALDFLASPLPVYLVLPASAWQDLEAKVAGRHHVIGLRRDMYRRCEVVVVANQ